ncbi:MAG TPA: aldehyde dehydrogenase family protein [Phycisphaerae bacterium]|nr:aldehyde dehydrogenase family protein [Phycisphaerae bacterium]
MSTLSDTQIDLIARRVAAKLGASTGHAPIKGNPQPRLQAAAADSIERGGVLPMGVFRTIDECVAAARKAFEAFSQIGLESRKGIIAAIRASTLEHAEDLAREAQEETGLGRAADKSIKNRLVTRKTPGPEVLEPRAHTGDNGLTLMERAPFGVIAAITPTTNPTSTIICNSIGMVAAGNSVVFNVHPNAKRVSCRNVGLINEAIVRAGGPPNVVTAMADPTIESAQELMKHKGVRLLVVTGGPGVVKAAMASGKRAICAGPGNPPVVVDETADIEKAGRDIVLGASFDNNVICTDEKEVFIVEAVADRLLKVMERNNAVVLTQPQTRAIEKVIFEETRGPRKPGVINRKWIGKNASAILAEIGMRVPDSVRLAVLDVPVDHPLIWTEQLMPVLPVARVKAAGEAIENAIAAEHGFGHSAAMHSMHIGNLSRMAREINCSIFVKNGPIYAGLGEGGEGYCSFSIASPTGEGLTDPRSFSRERRCVLVDHFRIV